MPQDPAAPPARRPPSTVALAIMITLTLLAVAGLGWVWLTRYAPVHYDIGNATLADARDATWVGPLLGLGIALVALLWVVTWALARWEITPLPIIIGMIGVLVLVLAGRAFWLSRDAVQPIQLVTYTCDADASRIRDSAEEIPDGCEPVPEPGGATIGTTGDRDMITSTVDDDRALRFPDLPEGVYDAILTASAQPDTAAITLAARTEDGVRPVSRLEHANGTQWTGNIALHPNLETYLLLMYDSPYPAAPEASLRFTVQQCVGTSVARFDAARCEPATMAVPVVEPVPARGEEDPGRAPFIAIRDDTLVMTNLEERTYTFAPTIALVGNGILVIPSEDTQTADRNILRQEGAPLGTFTVPVTGQTRERAYTVYVIDEGTTFASVAGMRP